MAICPFAQVDLVPANFTQGRINPTTLIFHEAVSQAVKLRPGDPLEWHFYIGPSGQLYQFMDTNVRADANVQANAFAISCETWDNGGDVNGVWNPAQLSTAKRLAAWCCDTHGIRRAPPTSWNSGGIGGHNWFPTQWAGGPRACPGPNRSAQIRNVIIPYVAGGGGWQTVEDDMQADERTWLYQLWQVIGEAYSLSEQAGNARGLGKIAFDTDQRLKAVEAKVSGPTSGPGVLSDADVARIAKAVVDEDHRRSEA